MISKSSGDIKKIISWIAVVMWMAIIFLLSHQPAEVSNDLSTGVTEIIIETIEKIVPDAGIETAEFNNAVRKNAHFFAYMILGILLMNAFSRRKKASCRADIKASFAISFIYAISDEIHQMFVPGRGALVTDVLIDSTGALIGIFIYWTIKSLILRNRKKKIPGRIA